MRDHLQDGSYYFEHIYFPFILISIVDSYQALFYFLNNGLKVLTDLEPVSSLPRVSESLLKTRSTTGSEIRQFYLHASHTRHRCLKNLDSMHYYSKIFWLLLVNLLLLSVLFVYVFNSITEIINVEYRIFKLNVVEFQALRSIFT